MAFTRCGNLFVGPIWLSAPTRKFTVCFINAANQSVLITPCRIAYCTSSAIDARPSRDMIRALWFSAVRIDRPRILATSRAEWPSAKAARLLAVAALTSPFQLSTNARTTTCSKRLRSLGLDRLRLSTRRRLHGSARSLPSASIQILWPRRPRPWRHRSNHCAS